MNTPRRTLGELLADLQSSEHAFEENMRTASRVEARDGNALAAHWWITQAHILRIHPTPSTHPGVDLVEALCDEWGSGLTSDNVRRLRNKICKTLAIGTENANAMTLVDVAGVLGLTASTAHNTSLHNEEVMADELPEYAAVDQPWYTQLPPVTDAHTGDILALAHDIDIVLMTATDTEIEAVLRSLRPLPGHPEILKGRVEQETYYLGMIGHCRTAATKCRPGSVDAGAAALATQHAQRIWRPRAIVMVGIAFGKDQGKQRIADVIVANQIISYEPSRVGTDSIISRGPIPPSSPTLLNRFENTLEWSFTRPDGTPSRRLVGPLVSGEKLVDHPEFKATLFERYPQAIGGEMEGVGVSAAAVRENVPWIVVKAICDWADGKKDKVHQPLAAAAAVSLVNHVMSQPDVLNGLDKTMRDCSWSPGADSQKRQLPESAPGRIVPMLRLRDDATSCPTSDGMTHWFRMWIKNESQTGKARSVEIVAHRAFKVTENGNVAVPGFAPSPLLWSHDLTQCKEKSLPPQMGALCDIGYVPIRTAGEKRIAEVFPGRGGNEKRPFVIHVAGHHTNRFNELLPGTYCIEIAIVVDCGTPTFYTLRIVWSGIWRETIDMMIDREIAIAIEEGALKC